MEKNTIKKLLYKEKPMAAFQSVNKAGILYTAHLRGLDGGFLDGIVSFLVPVEDIGDATFHPQMEAQLLIRYLV